MTTRSAKTRAAAKMREIEQRLQRQSGAEPSPDFDVDGSDGDSLARLAREVVDAERTSREAQGLKRQISTLEDELGLRIAELESEADRLRDAIEKTEASITRVDSRSPADAGPPSADAGQLYIVRLIAQRAARRQHLARADLGDRLVEAEWRVLLAEGRAARLRARRMVRLLEVVSGWRRHPWKLGRLVRGLSEALSRERLPELPMERPSLASVGVEASKSLLRGTRSMAYPGLRVAHWGDVSTFDDLCQVMEVAGRDWREGLDKVGYDLLLVEESAESAELPNDLLEALRDKEVPVVVMARTPRHIGVAEELSADLTVCLDPSIVGDRDQPGETLESYPTFDDSVHNPIGWQRRPPHGLLVISDRTDAATDLESLQSVSDQIHIFGQAIDQLPAAQHDPQRPFGVELSNLAKQYAAAYVSPHLSLSIAAYVQLALELTAAGTPVIAAPSHHLDAVLEKHYLPAATPDQLQTILGQMTDPATRERFSVGARRHTHTHHTNLHLLERILTKLDIPTNPPDRISILLATNRPDHLQHAIDNVTRQDWPNKELILILHGDNFDDDQIQQTLQHVPYPTQIVPCPPNWTLGDCLNTGLDHATGTHITKMDDDDHYGPHHLTDLHTALTYSNANITGKWSNVVYLSSATLTLDWKIGKQEKFGSHIPGATMFGERELFLTNRFARVRKGVDSELWIRLRSKGARLYSTHRFGFIRVRHGEHTFQTNDARFIGASDGEMRRGFDASSLTI